MPVVIIVMTADIWTILPSKNEFTKVIDYIIINSFGKQDIGNMGSAGGGLSPGTRPNTGGGLNVNLRV